MKTIAALSFSFILSGCMVMYAPAIALHAIEDSITGAEGANCVEEQVQVGDRVMIGKSIGVVKSLSGKSARCKDVRPIRALVEIEK